MTRDLPDVKQHPAWIWIAVALLPLALGTQLRAQSFAPPERDYFVLVASEATDRIALVRWGPSGAELTRQWTVGINPTDPEGPHGIGVSPDGRYSYVSTAHGEPFGYLWKYEAATGRSLGHTMLGYFPATLDIDSRGEFAYVVNFNLHGDLVPSSVSVVALDEMLEVARITTCIQPHGSRLSPQGTRHYSACVKDDIVIEIDTRTFSVSRHFLLTEGAEHGRQGAPPAPPAPPTGEGRHSAMHGEPTCLPTWVQPSADGSVIYAACNRSNEIVEIDYEGWNVRRRVPAGNGVYNLGVTSNGRYLIATNKRGQSVSVFDTESLAEVAHIPTIRPVVHGVAVSPDDRYAFISVEGIGSEPGTVEIIDLEVLERVASVDVGQMAGGIVFWRGSPPPPAPASP